MIKGSGADAAGLQGVHQDAMGRVRVMDEILAVGGDRVHTVEDLMVAIESFQAGDVCPMTVRRSNGEMEEVSVRLSEKMPMG